MKFLYLMILLPLFAQANVVGTDIQNFNPTTSGIDFVTVQSPTPLDVGVFNFGYFLNYATNTMPNYEDGLGSRTNFSDSLLGADINMGLGVFKNLEVGISFPQVYAQDTDDENNVVGGEISETGLTEYRIMTKYRWWHTKKMGFATVLSANFNQVEDNPFVGDDAGPAVNLEAVLGWYWKKLAFATNAGYRWRDPGTPIAGIPVQPFDDQWIYSFAVSKYFEDSDLKFISELYGSFPATDQSQTTDKDISSLELLAGVKKSLRHNLDIHGGLSTEIYDGSASPDWRVYAGINYNLGPVWGQVRKKKTRRGHRRLSKKIKYFGTKTKKKAETFVASNVFFDHDSDVVKPEFAAVLVDLSKYLLSGTELRSVRVLGHTDSVGPANYNLDLSIRRAQSVVKTMIEQGKVPENIIKAAGYGERRPVASNANYQGRAQNRRVEFKIIRKATKKKKRKK